MYKRFTSTITENFAMAIIHIIFIDQIEPSLVSTQTILEHSSWISLVRKDFMLVFAELAHLAQHEDPRFFADLWPGLEKEIPNRIFLSFV